MTTLRHLPVLFCAGLLFGFFHPAAGSCRQALDQNLLKNLTYRSIGPTRQSGRFVDFAVPDQETCTFYAATASGEVSWGADSRSGADANYEYSPTATGDYRFMLQAGGQTLTAYASILEDHWHAR